MTAWIKAAALLAGLLLLGAEPARSHDWYSGKRSKESLKYGHDCCSGYDCEKVSAVWRDGQWVGVWRGKEYAVPEDAIMPDDSNGEPLEASMCVHNGKVLCFWRRAAGG